MSLLFLLLLPLLSTTKIANAQDASCAGSDITVLGGIGTTVPEGTDELVIGFDLRNLESGNYHIKVWSNDLAGLYRPLETSATIQKTDENPELYFTLSGQSLSQSATWPDITRNVLLYRDTNTFSICSAGSFQVDSLIALPDLTCSDLRIYQNRIINDTQTQCYSSGCLQANQPIFVEGGAFQRNGVPETGSVNLLVGQGIAGDSVNLVNLDASGNVAWQNSFSPGSYRIVPKSAWIQRFYQGSCDVRFRVQENCPINSCSTNPLTSANQGPFELCEQIPDGALKQSCRSCVTSSNGTWTAIGCIENDVVPLTQRLIELGLGLGGGIALLTTIAAGFILTTSQGDPQRANQAKEMMTASVVGLLFIIFSVVILQFIGVTIFRIPGFGMEIEG